MHINRSIISGAFLLLGIIANADASAPTANITHATRASTNGCHAAATRTEYATVTLPPVISTTTVYTTLVFTVVPESGSSVVLYSNAPFTSVTNPTAPSALSVSPLGSGLSVPSFSFTAGSSTSAAPLPGLTTNGPVQTVTVTHIHDTCKHHRHTYVKPSGSAHYRPRASHRALRNEDDILGM